MKIARTLSELERQVQHDREEGNNMGKKKKYTVCIKTYFEDFVDVEATNQSEALDKVENMIFNGNVETAHGEPNTETYIWGGEE